MTREQSRFLQIAAMIVLILITILLLESALTLLLNPISLQRLFTFESGDAFFFASGLNRNFNQLLALVFTTVSIAIPLTANMYSVKFLELFITDELNLLMLSLIAFGGLNNTWMMHNLKDGYVPYFHLYLSLGLYMICVCLLIPYLYYIFRFLDPNTLLRRLEREIMADLASAQRKPSQAAARAREVAQSVEHIASVGLRSVDRMDRATAIESVNTLRRVLQAYWEVKDKMPMPWFNEGAGCFHGFAEEMMEDLRTNHTWMEMKVLSQFRSLLSVSVSKMHDLVNAIASATSTLGLAQEVRRERHSEELVMEYFNTFIRLALTRRDTRSVYSLFYQYRRYAEGLLQEDGDLALEIAYYFQYYAQAAREMGLLFVVETAAYDMGMLVQIAWEREAAIRSKLLKRFLAFDSGMGSQPLLGVKKAQSILAGFFLLHGLPEQTEQIRHQMQDISPRMIGTLRDDLIHVTREKFWEITERRVSMDYVVPPQRQRVAEFLDSLDSSLPLATPLEDR
ncbi:MAG: DUF2254 domain-containing protein [Ardenticatenales bacterium]|nr:DUF2254 domain-containing protein [Ardenticatenales bacterium]